MKDSRMSAHVFAVEQRSWLVSVLLFTVGVVCVDVARTDADEKIDFFESKVRPLLIEHCYECHSLEADESAGDYRLDSAAAMLRGGSRGPSIVAGDAAKSLFLKAVEYKDSELEMPPSGKLSDEQIDVLRQWVEAGAVDPRSTEEEAAHATPAKVDPAQHWAFQPFRRAAPPQKIEQPAHDILDALVAEHLNGDLESGKDDRRNPVASPETLIRRLTFDLTGLAPTKNEIDSFIEDSRIDAYERLVDRLLASPAFGERFGRYWLDVARYADTVGYTLAGRERRLAGSHLYRDWTIKAFNQDLPYDEMIRYQLAADRLDPENKAGHLDAMGFLTVGRRFLRRHDTIDDRIDVISRGLLGLTVACARCHDHKFDPIPTLDYYSLYGVISSSREKEDGPSPLMLEDHNPRDSHVFVRGQAGNRGPKAPREYLTALRGEQSIPLTTGSGRIDLAEQIASAENPLTARVMVNRVWGHLIGKPLLSTPSDFGVRSPAPEIPALMDDLASEFAEDWSLKRLVRRIVTTHIYQQSSTATEESITADPDNQQLARANRRRRDFESLRDNLLLASGRLSRTLGGEPVEITVTPAIPRRTVYAFIDRQNLPGIFRTFDFASPDAHTPQRAFTTVPQQALFLLNDPMVLDAAADVANRAMREVAEDDPAEWIQAIYGYVLGRTPSKAEHEAALTFLKLPESTMQPSPDPRSVWEYGYSTITESGAASSFTPFPKFEEGRWKHDKAETDPAYKYLFLTKGGGHPGNGNDLVPNRRWVPPADGEVEILGALEHPSMKGNGVKIVIASGDKVYWQTDLHKRKQPYGPIRVPVKKGQAIDFLAGDNGGTNSDSFRWKISLHFKGTAGEQVDSDSELDFSGPFQPGQNEPLTRPQQLAHALLMSNEFIFVD
ncbi:PSD1 and planctomycete cytochrome C domain-containing protein [Roseimaritima multifibrata]|nr:PSD1 and planctomycete cytochrome C domain-containing protein [Roseimaritima multifibrata]